MGGGGIAGIAHGMWVGVLWQDKMGSKWEKNGTRYPFFTVAISPFPPIFPGGQRSSPQPLCKNQLTALTDRKITSQRLLDQSKAGGSMVGID